MLDETDRALVHALHLDGRAPFNRVAAVLGVSTQTIARRYRQLRATAGLRVVGLSDAARVGHAQWLVRLTATPRNAQDVARALAQRTDTSWVKLASGGTEIAAVVRTPLADATSHPLLLHDIPRTAAVTAVSAQYLLHTYLGGPTAWSGRVNALTPEQQQELTPIYGRSAEVAADSEPDPLLLAALERDGRATLAELAAATSRSPATIARRLTELLATGTLFFDVEMDSAQLGGTTQALLWMAVAPGRLDQVATALAAHPELAFVAATTGSTNLVAHAVCISPDALHSYLIGSLGATEGIHTVETAPVLRTLKAGGRLPPVRLS